MKYLDASIKIDRYMWIWIANKYAKFHAKRHNRSENIQKRFRGYFFETPCISYNKESVQNTIVPIHNADLQASD